MLHSLLDFVLTNELKTKEVALAADLKTAGKLADIKIFSDKLAAIGPKYGYFCKANKSYLILKKMPKRCKDHVY